MNCVIMSFTAVSDASASADLPVVLEANHPPAIVVLLRIAVFCQQLLLCAYAPFCYARLCGNELSAEIPC